MFYREWGLQKMDKAEKFEEMIAVFNSFPLNKDNFNDFYVELMFSFFNKFII